MESNLHPHGIFVGIDMNSQNFTQKINELIHAIDRDESENIKKAAKIIFESMKRDGLLHVFSTGHSHMMAEELFYRAGGLVQVDPILEPILMQHEGAYRSTQMERLSGLAEVVFNGLDVKDGEPFLIVSNSGINAVPIEMAECAKKRGNPVIVVTSVSSSEKLASRTKSGKHLYELGDVVIDNHSPNGDGLLLTKDGQLVGASSTIVCSYIAQRLVIDIVNDYEEEGLEPAIYKSANTVGGDEHNKEILTRFKGRIRSLY